MTNSLYQNIQALGNRIASNLETMGVSASFNDGGLTLADKILEIQSMANGVFLTSDKSIIQSGGTARLAAIAVKDGQLVNSDIRILGADKSFSNSMTSNVNGFTTIRGDGFTVSSSGATLSSTGSTGSYVYCNTAINLQRTNSIIRFKCKESESSGTAFCGQISYNDGTSEYNTSMSIDTQWGASFFETTGTMPTGASVSDWLDVVIVITTTSQKVYINGELSVTASKDFSSQWDEDLYFTFFNSIGDFIVKDFSIDVGTVVATGSNGTANGTYTGSGAGKTNFIGVSGSVVSAPYEVCDCYVIDEAVTGKKSTDCFDYANRLDEDTDSEGTKLTNTSQSSKGWYAFGKHGVSHSVWNDFIEFSDSFCLEVDIVDSNSNGNSFFFNDSSSTPGLIIYLTDFGTLLEGVNHFKIVYTGTKVYGYLNGSTTATVDVNCPFNPARVGFTTYESNGKYLKYKNLRIYPINIE